MNSGVRVKDSFGNQKFGTKEKLIAAGAILPLLGIGAVGGYVASTVFSGYSQGKEYFIKGFKSFNPTSINFGVRNGLRIFNKKGIIMLGAIEVTRVLFPELEGEKFNKKAIEIDNVTRNFSIKYNQNLLKKCIEIASRHKFCVFGDVTEGFKDISDLTIKVIPEDEKLTVRIFEFSNQEGMLVDVTKGFINVEKENGKAFIDDLVEFVNSDDFMKQVLLGGKDEKAEGEKMAKKMKTK